MHDAMRLLLQQRETKTMDMIATEIGYSRTAISLYLADKYGAGVDKLEAALLARYQTRTCPHTGHEKHPLECVRIALRPRPYGWPESEAIWLACQACPHKPPTPSEKDAK